MLTDKKKNYQGHISSLNTLHQKSKKEILIIEDSATQSEFLKHLLIREGYIVRIAKDGVEGLQMVREQKPSLIISDIIMPRMDGYALCREIKRDRILKSIPIILLTVLSDPEEIIYSLSHQIDGYITKPYDENLLLFKIRSILSKPYYNNCQKVQQEFSFYYNGKNYSVTADHRQILNLLLFTYEHLITQNQKLLRVETELKRLNEQLEERIKERTARLEEAATKDMLTGLFNRYSFDLDQNNLKEPVLLLVNIDNFKHTNDFYGIKAGDFILKRLSEILKGFIPKDLNAKLYRLGADDFGISFDNFSNYNPEILAQTIISEVGKEAFIYDHYHIAITISIGISREKPLLEKANMALKYVKKNTRMRFLTYKKDLNLYDNISRNLNILSLLKNAIKRDAVVVYFQPILNNNNGEIEKYECLVRAIDENNRILTPGSFLPIIKETKLYEDITEIMVEKSVAAMKNTRYEFSLNLSIEDILDKRFHAFVKGIFNSHAEIARRVTFEILESEGIENYQLVHDFIREMKKYGCKIAIDDFGAGYSNFEHILRLDVNYLNISSSLIKNIDFDIHSQIIVETIINFTKKLHIKTIAEHVHTEEIYKKVKMLGIDYSQGDYIGEPEPTLRN
jgi:diguanylate cyclase (GGDEF)-like protein